jgi:predicted DNA-binding transcriptional regulator AlpA
VKNQTVLKKLDRQDGIAEIKKVFLTEREASEITGMKPSWFSMARHKGEGPPYIKLSRACRYDREKLIQYFNDRIIDPAMEAK